MSDEYGNDNVVTIENILDAWPEAKPFQDLIQATDVDSYAAVAREIALKVRGIKPNQQPSLAPGNPEPEKGKAVSVDEAISAKSWPDYLAAKWEAANRD